MVMDTSGHKACGNNGRASGEAVQGRRQTVDNDRRTASKRGGTMEATKRVMRVAVEGPQRGERMTHFVEDSIDGTKTRREDRVGETKARGEANALRRERVCDDDVRVGSE